MVRRARARKSGGTRKKRGCRGWAPARCGPIRRALQFGGHTFVRSERRLRAVPGAAIGIDLPVGRIGQRAVGLLPLVQRRRCIDRRTHQGMAKSHPTSQLKQSGPFGGRCGVGTQSQLRGRSPEQLGVAHRLGRRDQQEFLRLGG
jgi:hypothetical protein